MRLALLSDIHGNTLALDAVLLDIERRGGVDAYWVLGDFTAMGYDPVGVMERITKLPHARFIQGNHERYVITGEFPGTTVEQAQTDPQLVPKLLATSTCLAWEQGQILGSGWWRWFEALPFELRETLPDGTRLLGVHVAPGIDDGPGIIPTLSDDELRSLVSSAEADLVVVSHTHVPLDRQIDGTRILNLGSISNPMRTRLEATYAILEANEDSYAVELYYVPYDYEEVVRKLYEVKHPAAPYLERFIRGQHVPAWAL